MGQVTKRREETDRVTMTTIVEEPGVEGLLERAPNQVSKHETRVKTKRFPKPLAGGPTGTKFGGYCIAKGLQKKPEPSAGRR